VGAAISVLFFMLNGSFIPSTYKQSNLVQREKIQKKGGATFLQNKIWLRINGRTLLYTRLVDAKKNAMYGVHFYYLGSPLPIEREITAALLRYEMGKWILSNGVDLRYQKDGTVLRIPFITKEIQIAQTLLEIQKMEIQSDEMTYDQLRLYIDQLQKDGLNANRYQVDLNRKYAFPFSNFVLALLGIPIGFQYLRKSGMAKSFLLGLGVVLLYWLSFSITYSLGRLEQIPPWLSGWGPHLFFLTAGMVLLIRLHRRAQS
jgi:lipopolysaccharide export system permease protein